MKKKYYAISNSNSLDGSVLFDNLKDADKDAEAEADYESDGDCQYEVFELLITRKTKTKKTRTWEEVK